MKRTIIPVLLGIFTQTLFAQSVTFTRTYGGEKYDNARCLAPARNKCFVFTGLSNSGNSSQLLPS